MNQRNLISSTVGFVFAGFWLLVASYVQADTGSLACGSMQNAYGPFDYRSDKDKLGVVEAYHFTPEVASLTRGKSGHLGGDIDYTLRAFPNHPRALMAMVQLGEREKVIKVAAAQYTVECYLQRAIRFRDDDGMAKMIYANYLVKKGRGKEALKQLNDAASLNDDNTSLDYNIGLVYVELKDFDKALIYAHKAYLGGFPLPGLRDRLKRAGKWRDPAPTLESTAVDSDRKGQLMEENGHQEDASSKPER